MSETGAAKNKVCVCVLVNEHVTLFFFFRSWYGVVGIATRYGLEGPGIESRWGPYFPHLSGPAPRPTQHPVQWVPGLSGIKAAGAWC